MFRYKRIIASILATSMALPTVTVGASTSTINKNVDYKTSAFHSINNENIVVDSKLNQDAFDEIYKAVKGEKMDSVDKDETDIFKNKAPIQNVSVESDADSNKDEYNAIAKSWLIQNGILERKVKFSFDNGFVIKRYEDLENDTSRLSYIIKETLDYLESSSLTEDTKKMVSEKMNSCANDLKGAIQTLFEDNYLSESKYNKFIKYVNTQSKQFNDSIKSLECKKVINLANTYLNRYYTYFAKYDGVLSVSDSDTIRKSDLLVYLGKGLFGKKVSRPIVYNLASIRNAETHDEITQYYWKNGFLTDYQKDYWGKSSSKESITSPPDQEGNTSVEEVTTITHYNADFSEKDWYVYQSDSVYELYFKDLLDRGLIKRSEFSDKYDNTGFFSTSSNQKSVGQRFLDDYDKYASDELPLWDSSNNYYVSSTSSADPVLGYSQKVELVPGDPESGNLTQQDPTYFDEEELQTLDVLKIIEKFVRLSEKDMSELETAIVTYKYGIQYLSDLSESDRKTVSFLIAKGILDFENPELIINLYGTLSRADAFALLYRTINKDARYDFSEIQLTDSDSFWQAKGYSENNVSIVETAEPAFMLENVHEEQDEVSLLQRLSSLFIQRVYAATKKDYTVMLTLDKNCKYTYNSIDLDSLNSSSSVQNATVTDTTVSYNNKRVSAYKLTVKVSATSEEAALSYVKNNLRVTSGNIAKNINAVTKIKTGSKKTTLIPKSALLETISSITIIEDKVLQNTKTGAMAVLLPDKGYALVGNTIIKDTDLIVTNTAGEVYYNLEVICSLLETAYLKKIGVTDTLFICDTMREYTLDSANDSELLYFGKVTLSDVKLTKAMSPSSSDTGNISKAGSMAHYYKVNSVTRGVNTLIRTFSVKDKNNKDASITIVVDWDYVIPSTKSFNVNDWYKEATNTSVLTIKEATDIINKRPSNGMLQAWWDSNYGVSNALANFMYGTQGIEYVRCGYLAPSLTILKSTDKIGDEQLNGLFQDNGFAINNTTSADYSKYVGGTTNKFWKHYFNGAGLTGATKGLATSNRHYTELTAKKFSTGYFYGVDYFMSESGILYRNLDSDDRFSYELKGVGSNETVKSLNFSVRSTKEFKPTIGSNVKWKNKDWLYVQTTSDGYIELIPNFETTDSDNVIHGNLDLSSGKPSIIQKVGSGSTQLDKSAKELLDYYYKIYFDLDSSKIHQETISEMFTFNEKLKYAKLINEFYYLAGSSVKRYNSSTGYISSLSSSEMKSFTSQIVAFPRIKLPAGSFYIYDDNGVATIGEGAYACALNLSNIFYSGLNDGIMNSILSNSLKTIKAGEMLDGQQLFIADTTWVKSGDYFYSKPIKDANLIKSLRGNKKSITKGVLKLFNGLTILADGRYFPLTNYFSECDIGPLAQGNVKSKYGILFKDKTGTYIRRNGKNQKSTKKAEYACVKMKINDDLLVRPLDSNGKQFIYAGSASSAFYTTDGNLPFFEETLSYGKSQYANVTMQSNKYSPSKAFLSQRDKFNALFKRAFANDLYSLAKLIVLCIVSYIAVMGWICYGIINYDIGLIILKTLNGSGKGFDLMKIMTFGFYRIDDDLPASRVFIITLVCFIIAWLILNIL